MLAEYIYLGDQLLVMIKPGELAYYFHGDHLGTPQILTDDSQAIVWKAAYAPFGDAVVSIETVENPFRFPGQYYDPETGLHYNYFRYYNPQTGRYITPDPIGLEGGINLFAYVANNPVNLIDLWGLSENQLGYWSTVWNNFISTSEAPISIIGHVGIGLLTSEYMAGLLGTEGIIPWVASGFSGAFMSGASFTGIETGIIAFGTETLWAVPVGLSYEFGVALGSLISSIPIGGQTLSEYLANKLFPNSLSPHVNPCIKSPQSTVQGLRSQQRIMVIGNGRINMTP
jgi:RHS repeat-associated protein